ncbi:MAG: hypothetical protein WDO15_12555 [Bacteroidota bacterium]
MAFNGNEGEMIDPKLGQQMIDNYQKNIGPKDNKALFFGVNRLQQLLNQGQAVGLRFYFAKDSAGLDTLVVVAADANEKNIGPIDGSKSAGLVGDSAWPCPPYCNVAD